MGNYREYANREMRGPEGIVHKIRMVRNYPNSSYIAFLLVEGEKDRKVYARFVDSDNCHLIVAYSKKTLIDTVMLLDQTNMNGVLGIIDADFDVLEGKSYASSNLVFTDTHDLETMIIQSGAFEKLLIEFGSDRKIVGFIAQTGKDIRSYLLECSSFLGYLRWVSLREGLALSFETLDFDKFIDKETLVVDELKLIRIVKDISSNNHPDKAHRRVIWECDPHKSIKEIKRELHNRWHICCGHDLVNIVSVGLTRALGTHNTKSVEPEMIEKLLRLAYEYSHFRQTYLYASIRSWEETNAPFVILRAE